MSRVNVGHTERDNHRFFLLNVHSCVMCLDLVFVSIFSLSVWLDSRHTALCQPVLWLRMRPESPARTMQTNSALVEKSEEDVFDASREDELLGKQNGWCSLLEHRFHHTVGRVHASWELPTRALHPWIASLRTTSSETQISSDDARHVTTIHVVRVSVSTCHPSWCGAILCFGQAIRMVGTGVRGVELGDVAFERFALSCGVPASRQANTSNPAPVPVFFFFLETFGPCVRQNGGRGGRG